MKVYVKCETPVKISIITDEQIQKLRDNYMSIDRIFLVHQSKIYAQQKVYPLDYIVNFDEMIS